MPILQTAFDPVRHGFVLSNAAAPAIPIHYALPGVGTLRVEDLVTGLDGGLCFSALDSFHAGGESSRAADLSALGKPAFARLCDRHLDCLPVTVAVDLLGWTMLDPTAAAARSLREELPRLRRQLKRGLPAVAALIPARRSGQAARVAIVVITALDEDPAQKRAELALYDPNRPGETRRVSFAFKSAPPAQGWLAFALLPYTPRALPMQLAARPALTVPFHLAWPVDSRRVNQFFGENPASYKPFGLPGHEGLDLFAMTGANIYACADGVVEQSGHPSNHPYGLHIRVKHEAGGKSFLTIYAHLSETLVKVNDTVSAGQRIGLADNSGNSFGSHLHLTLKIDGEKTPGYPAGIVDPWPYLQEPEPVPEPVKPVEPLPEPSGVTIYTLGQVNLRAAPSTFADILTILPPGEALSALGEAAVVRDRIGKQDAWIPVRAASGVGGYVAAWLTQSESQPFPPSDLVVYPFDTLNLRSGPGVAFPVLAALTAADALTVLGDADLARGKLGRMGEWIQVQTAAGQHGFAAAWLVRVTGQNPPASGMKVFPTTPLKVRARPAVDGNILVVTLPGDALIVLGDAAAAEARIGQQGQWLNVSAPQGVSGYVAAWLVQKAAPSPVPGPAPEP
ncbi:MAG: SH3 domain-containing protein, partial [Anaerolineae bacterium]|nr:SH3 domain-containing protein [Anaerolineae bacterium]